jgi:hypothetical protein
MTDTEALNLVEHYGWRLVPLNDGKWFAMTVGGATAVQSSLRDAIRAALAKQAAWALGTEPDPRP